jgi:hypothetical protein
VGSSESKSGPGIIEVSIDALFILEAFF